MKSVHSIVAITLMSVALAGTAFAKEKQDGTDEALSAAAATVTLDQAVTTALTTVPGKAVTADFSDKKDAKVWKIEVVSADNLVHELEIDAATGSVVKQGMADEAKEGDEDGDAD